MLFVPAAGTNTPPSKHFIEVPVDPSSRVALLTIRPSLRPCLGKQPPYWKHYEAPTSVPVPARCALAQAPILGEVASWFFDTILSGEAPLGPDANLGMPENGK